MTSVMRAMGQTIPETVRRMAAMMATSRTAKTTKVPTKLKRTTPPAFVLRDWV
jgi:hypothetical protein